MRKSIVCCILAALLILAVADFGITQARFKPGLKFGITMGQQAMEPDPAIGSHSNVAGFSFGIIFERPWGERLKFSPEILFVKTGDKLTHRELGDTYTSQFDNKFIMIPFIFRYYFPKGKLKPYVLGGPELGILVSSNRTPPFQGNESVTGTYKRSAVSYTVGAGVEYKLSNSPLSVLFEARYSKGIQDMSSDPIFEYSPSINYRVIYFSTGVKF